MITNVTVENATKLEDYCTGNKTSETDPEHRLLADLMKNYNLDARPILNKSKPVEVLFDLALTQIVELVSGNENPKFSSVLVPTSAWVQNHRIAKYTESHFPGFSRISAIRHRFVTQ